MSIFPTFNLISEVCAPKCPRFQSDKSVLLCGVYHQQAWIWCANRPESARGAQTERSAFCLPLSLSLCLSLSSGQEFPKSTLREGEHRKESGPSARKCKYRTYSVPMGVWFHVVMIFEIIVDIVKIIRIQRPKSQIPITQKYFPSKTNSFRS